MLRHPSHGFRAARAFTLIELLTVVVVMTILATMLTGVFADIRGRADRAKCVQNLKNLYTSAANYVAQQGAWPQIDPTAGGTNRRIYAKAWIAALEPLGLSSINWICPTVQRVLDNPDLSVDDNVRI